MPHREDISKNDLASMIEHTLLQGELDDSHIIAHVQEAVALKVYGVCIPLAWVPLAKKTAQQTPLKIITVIDFPLGQKSAKEKAQEALVAKQFGADEIDMVLDYQALIKKNYHKALQDLIEVVQVADPVPVKVIVETSALNRDQLAIAIALVALSDAAFIKTSTGFHKGGARVEDVALMRALLPEHIQIKASGGIKDFSSAQALLRAGATRLGCSKSRIILNG